jgi:hypothetical protein
MSRPAARFARLTGKRRAPWTRSPSVVTLGEGLPQELVGESGEWLGVDTDPPTRRRTKSYWWSGGFAAARQAAG